jgi:septum formation topological specificity factor MinE
VKLKTARSKEDTEEQQRLATMRADPEIQAILQKYGNVDSTPLHYEIKNNQTIDIVLD